MRGVARENHHPSNLLNMETSPHNKLVDLHVKCESNEPGHSLF